MAPVQSTESESGANCALPTSRRHSCPTKKTKQNKTKQRSRSRISKGRANVASMETRIDFTVISELKKSSVRTSRGEIASECRVYGITAVRGSGAAEFFADKPRAQYETYSCYQLLWPRPLSKRTGIEFVVLY